jgi:hypothetical protein
MNEPLVAARTIVGELFPAARWAVLAGSVLTAARTPGSDLDIVVCQPPDEAGLPYRRSLRSGGWPVELFVHDQASLEHYPALDLAGRRPSLHRMLATGRALYGHDGEPARTQARCASVLADGPPPMETTGLDRRRYELTDLLDDLTHSGDPAETVTIAATLWTRAAELALHADRHWLDGGKWLLRELRDLDAEFADRWIAAHGDPTQTAVFARDILDRVGGPLFDGYRAAGERPAIVTAS